MKTSLLLGLFLLVGCSHSPGPKAPENYGITETSHECNGNSCRVVTRTILPTESLPKVQGTVESTQVPAFNPTTDEDDNPYAEDERNENLLKAMREAVERDTPCKCAQGDPLCACLGGHE